MNIALDNSDFVNEPVAGSSYVEYYLYKTHNDMIHGAYAIPKDIPGNVGEGKKYLINSNKACFAGLNNELSKHDYNRICYIPKPTKLKTQYVQKWLKLATANGYLPKYFSIRNFIGNNKVVFDLSAHTRDMLYVYLCMVRFPAAEGNYVRHVLTLVEKYNVEYTTAIVFAANISMGNFNHHFIPAGMYIKPDDVKNIHAMFNTIIGLHRYIKTGCDGIAMVKKYKLKSLHGFSCNKIISLLASVHINIGSDMVTNRVLKAAVKCNDDNAKKLLNMVRK